MNKSNENKEWISGRTCKWCLELDLEQLKPYK